MNIKPLSNQVLLRVISEEKTASGMYMPETAREDNCCKGEILAVGPGLVVADGQGFITVPSNLKPGLKVYFNKFLAAKIYEGGEDLYLIQEISILAIVEEAANGEAA